MNKKLIAVAVAGMFAAPAAFAQTTVTITGKAIASFGQIKIGGRAGGALGNNSETLIRDESSTLIFSMREDLGGGLAAIAKYDLRPSLDSGALAASGEDYVGLTSPTMGTIALGRFPLHYGNHASFTGVHSGLLSNPTALFDRSGPGAGVNGVAIPNQTRTPDVIRYGSPKFGDMFEIVVAHSTSGSVSASETDMKNGGLRKGGAWNVAPKIWGKNWEAGYSYWSAKPDAALAPATTLKHRGDSLYGWYMWGGLRVGLAYNKSKVDTTTVATGATATSSNRTVWGIPISYNWGSHTVYGDFYRAGNDKSVAGGNTKARFLGVTYAYDLSKRTSIAVSYAGIRNQAAASYNLFNMSSGNANVSTTAGEDPHTWNVTMAHRF